MNPIQISQPYRKSGQSKEVHTELPNSGVAFKVSYSLTEFIFLCAFQTLQIFPLSSVPTKLFSEMEIVLMQMLSRNWTDSILCILSELIQLHSFIPRPIPFPKSHKNVYREGEKHQERLMGSWTQRVAVGEAGTSSGVGEDEESSR